MANVSKSFAKPARRRISGAATAELALLLPVLIMLTFGVIDYGYYMYLKNTFQGAAQAGVRAAIPNAATNTSVTNVTSAMLTAAGISSSNYTVTLSPTNVSGVSAGTSITVTISGTWGNLGTHMLGSALGGISSTKSISASAVMLKESS